MRPVKGTRPQRGKRRPERGRCWPGGLRRRLGRLHRHGVDRARRLKPGIPGYGADMVPMAHELELLL